jgi:hypothetical protein
VKRRKLAILADDERVRRAAHHQASELVTVWCQEPHKSRKGSCNTLIGDLWHTCEGLLWCGQKLGAHPFEVWMHDLSHEHGQPARTRLSPKWHTAPVFLDEGSEQFEATCPDHGRKSIPRSVLLAAARNSSERSIVLIRAGTAHIV